MVVEQEGSVLFRVCLLDGKVIRRHSDQLRPRVGPEETRDGTTPDDPVESVETQTHTSDQSEGIPDSSDPEQGSESPPAERHEDPSNFSYSGSPREIDPPTNGSATETAAPEPRRSSRVRNPPVRFDQCWS